MEVWQKFLKEQNIDRSDIDSMSAEMDDLLANRVSPKIKEFQLRLAKLGMSEENIKNFIQFEGMSAKREKREVVLQRKIVALEKFAKIPLNKMPQQMKVMPGLEIEMMHNNLSWKGKVGDPKAPKWVQTKIPGWRTDNPFYPDSPQALGSAGRGILFRKLIAAAKQVKKAPAVQQKQAPAVQQKQTPAVQQKQTPAVQQKQTPAASNDIVKKVQSGKWTKSGKSFPKANPEVINLIYKLQGLIGAKQDGVFGKETAKAIQRKYYGK